MPKVKDEGEEEPKEAGQPEKCLGVAAGNSMRKQAETYVNIPFHAN